MFELINHELSVIVNGLTLTSSSRGDTGKPAPLSQQNTEAGAGYAVDRSRSSDQGVYVDLPPSRFTTCPPSTYLST